MVPSGFTSMSHSSMRSSDASEPNAENPPPPRSVGELLQLTRPPVVVVNRTVVVDRAWVRSVWVRT